MEKLYEKCELCARKCGVNRLTSYGRCGMMADVFVSRAAPHFWEEPPISGENGSGTIFFDGCSLGCVFCQNRDISRGRNGKKLSATELAEVMLKLQSQGVHNINLVTPTHFVPSIIGAIKVAKSKGLSIPIVYNTGSYDTAETIKRLNGLVDIYLPDFKYYTAKTARQYSSAEDYPIVAKEAIAEMVEQVGGCEFDDNGMMKKGVIVRILLLPGHVAEAKLILKYLYSTYGDSIYISLMSQYTPMDGMKSPLNRKVTVEEYNQLLDYAVKLGVTNAFIQEGAAASESFIPPFASADNNL